jgi:putative flavoprotein involved in K+ transport
MLEHESIGTMVIGGGQAGLSVGYHLQRLGVPLVILDAEERIGGAWRSRWDSLRLFTPVRYDGLDGKPFPATGHSFPTKDEMADYLVEYATEFDLPVRSGQRVKRLSKLNGVFLVETDDARFEADNVVVAMSSWQVPKVPEFAKDLRPEINQLPAAAYRNEAQLQEGLVLVVGAGNSGAEIALDVVGRHETIVAGPDTGHVPFHIESRVGRMMVPFVLRFLFHHVLTMSTPIGRRALRNDSGQPLVRTKPRDLADAGIVRAPRVTGVEDGWPVLEDGRVLHPANIVWCTGFDPGFSWIDLPVFDDGHVKHTRGVVEEVPGLYFVGLKGLYSVSSAEVHGVGRDAARVAALIASSASSRDLPASATARP